MASIEHKSTLHESDNSTMASIEHKSTHQESDNGNPERELSDTENNAREKLVNNCGYCGMTFHDAHSLILHFRGVDYTHFTQRFDVDKDQDRREVCVHCGGLFKGKHVCKVVERTVDHNKISLAKCGMCNAAVFKSRCDLSVHMYLKHVLEDLIASNKFSKLEKCVVCKRFFRTKKEVKEHERKHKVMKHFCKLCKEFYACTEDFDRHSHLTDTRSKKKGIEKGSRENDQYDNGVSLKSEVKIKNKKPKPLSYYCQLCKEFYSSKENFQNHTHFNDTELDNKKKIEDEGQISESEQKTVEQKKKNCIKRDIDDDDVEISKIEIAPKVTGSKKKTLEKSNNNQFEIEDRKRKKKSIFKVFPCMLCNNKVFTCRCDLYVHINRIHDCKNQPLHKLLKCKKCLKCFISEDLFEEHAERHFGNDVYEDKEFCCFHCGEFFAPNRYRDLEVHLDTFPSDDECEDGVVVSDEVINYENSKSEREAAKSYKVISAMPDDNNESSLGLYSDTNATHLPTCNLVETLKLEFYHCTKSNCRRKLNSVLELSLHLSIQHGETLTGDLDDIRKEIVILERPVIEKSQPGNNAGDGNSSVKLKKRKKRSHLLSQIRKGSKFKVKFTAENYFECRRCSEGFGVTSLLVDHLKKKHGYYLGMEKEDVLPAGIGQIGEEKDSVESSKVVDINQKGDVQFYMTEKRFKSLNEIKQEKSPEQYFQCECEKSYRTVTELSIHLKYDHGYYLPSNLEDMLKSADSKDEEYGNVSDVDSKPAELYSSKSDDTELNIRIENSYSLSDVKTENIEPSQDVLNTTNSNVGMLNAEHSETQQCNGDCTKNIDEVQYKLVVPTEDAVDFVYENDCECTAAVYVPVSSTTLPTTELDNENSSLDNNGTSKRFECLHDNCKKHQISSSFASLLDHIKEFHRYKGCLDKTISNDSDHLPVIKVVKSESQLRSAKKWMRLGRIKKVQDLPQKEGNDDDLDYTTIHGYRNITSEEEKERKILSNAENYQSKSSSVNSILKQDLPVQGNKTMGEILDMRKIHKRKQSSTLIERKMCKLSFIAKYMVLPGKKSPRVLAFYRKLRMQNSSYLCPWCTKSFLSRPAWMCHTFIFHRPKSEEFYTCRYCVAKFFLRINLKKHVKKVHSHRHSKIRRSKCSVCNKWFSSRLKLADHSAVAHKIIDSENILKSTLNVDNIVDSYAAKTCEAIVEDDVKKDIATGPTGNNIEMNLNEVDSTIESKNSNKTIESDNDYQSKTIECDNDGKPAVVQLCATDNSNDLNLSQCPTIEKDKVTLTNQIQMENADGNNSSVHVNGASKKVESRTDRSHTVGLNLSQCPTIEKDKVTLTNQIQMENADGNNSSVHVNGASKKVESRTDRSHTVGLNLSQCPTNTIEKDKVTLTNQIQRENADGNNSSVHVNGASKKVESRTDRSHTVGLNLSQCPTMEKDKVTLTNQIQRENADGNNSSVHVNGASKKVESRTDRSHTVGFLDQGITVNMVEENKSNSNKTMLKENVEMPISTITKNINLNVNQSEGIISSNADVYSMSKDIAKKIELISNPGKNTNMVDSDKITFRLVEKNELAKAASFRDIQLHVNHGENTESNSDDTVAVVQCSNTVQLNKVKNKPALAESRASKTIESSKDDNSAYYLYYCDFCTVGFRQQKDCAAHNATQEHKDAFQEGMKWGELKPYRCQLCGYTSRGSMWLGDHLLQKHQLTEAVRCTACNLRDTCDAKMKLIRRGGGEVEDWGENRDRNYRVVCQQCFVKAKKFMKELTDLNNEKSFCAKCFRKFDTIAMLKWHLRIKHRSNPENIGDHLKEVEICMDSVYKLCEEYENLKQRCCLCDKRFGYRHDLEIHFCRMHLKDRQFLCFRCNEDFNDMQEYDAHISKDDKCIVEPSSECDLQCEICGLWFQNQESLIAHIYKHSGKDALQCLECELVSENEHLLHVHLLQEHFQHHTKSGVKTFHCEWCGIGFGIYSDLLQHRYTVHNGNNSHVCTRCQGRFTSLELLKEHVDTEHIWVHACTHCQARFKSLEQRMEHFDTEHFRINVCTLCQARFKSLDLLREHLDTEHIRVNVCTHCQARYKSIEELKEHFEMQHIRKHACIYCQERFKSPKLLKEHDRLTHKIKFIVAYKCKHCHKHCNTENEIIAHVLNVHKSKKALDKAMDTRIAVLEIDVPDTEQNHFFESKGGSESENEMPIDNSNELDLELESSIGNNISSSHPLVEHAYHKSAIAACQLALNQDRDSSDNDVWSHVVDNYIDDLVNEEKPHSSNLEKSEIGIKDNGKMGNRKEGYNLRNIRPLEIINSNGEVIGYDSMSGSSEKKMRLDENSDMQETVKDAVLHDHAYFNFDTHESKSNSTYMDEMESDSEEMEINDKISKICDNNSNKDSDCKLQNLCSKTQGSLTSINDINMEQQEFKEESDEESHEMFPSFYGCELCGELLGTLRQFKAHQSACWFRKTKKINILGGTNVNSPIRSGKVIVLSNKAEKKYDAAKLFSPDLFKKVENKKQKIEAVKNVKSQVVIQSKGKPGLIIESCTGLGLGKRKLELESQETEKGLCDIRGVKWNRRPMIVIRKMTGQDELPQLVEKLKSLKTLQIRSCDQGRMSVGNTSGLVPVKVKLRKENLKNFASPVENVAEMENIESTSKIILETEKTNERKKSKSEVKNMKKNAGSGKMGARMKLRSEIKLSRKAKQYAEAAARKVSLSKPIAETGKRLRHNTFLVMNKKSKLLAEIASGKNAKSQAETGSVKAKTQVVREETVTLKESVKVKNLGVREEKITVKESAKARTPRVGEERVTLKEPVKVKTEGVRKDAVMNKKSVKVKAPGLMELTVTRKEPGKAKTPGVMELTVTRNEQGKAKTEVMDLTVTLKGPVKAKTQVTEDPGTLKEPVKAKTQVTKDTGTLKEPVKAKTQVTEDTGTLKELLKAKTQVTKDTGTLKEPVKAKTQVTEDTGTLKEPVKAKTQVTEDTGTLKEPVKAKTQVTKDTGTLKELLKAKTQVTKDTGTLKEPVKAKTPVTKDTGTLKEPVKAKTQVTEDTGTLKEPVKAKNLGVREERVTLKEPVKAKTQVTKDTVTLKEPVKAKTQVTEDTGTLKELLKAKTQVTKDTGTLKEPVKAKTQVTEDTGTLKELLKAKTQVTKDTGTLKELLKAKTQVTEDTGALKEPVKAKTQVTKDTGTLKEPVKAKTQVTKDTGALKEPVKAKTQVTKDTGTLKEPVKAKTQVTKDTGTLKELLKAKTQVTEDTGTLKEPVKAKTQVTKDTGTLKEPVKAKTQVTKDTGALKEPVKAKTQVTKDTGTLKEPVKAKTQVTKDTGTLKELLLK